ncbi:unnamed protein product, partial [Dovyalis caffra]
DMGQLDLEYVKGYESDKSDETTCRVRLERFGPTSMRNGPTTKVHRSSRDLRVILVKKCSLGSRNRSS